jgi:hypothetical protein
MFNANTLCERVKDFYSYVEKSAITERAGNQQPAAMSKTARQDVPIMRHTPLKVSWDRRRN